MIQAPSLVFPIERTRRPKLSVSLARDDKEILAAKRLRYRIFAGELGAKIASGIPDVDNDDFDPHCDHLIVRDEDAQAVVGTYRILSPENASKIGGYYTESEFDLAALRQLRPTLVEVGRSCVHPDYRTGATISLLWSGLIKYMLDHRYLHLVGCASISMADGGHAAASIYHRIGSHMSPAELRVRPLRPLPLGELRNDVSAEMPPLIKGYLRAGAYVCGEPAWDPDFNTADLPILLPMSQLNCRYCQHFAKGEA